MIEIYNNKLVVKDQLTLCKLIPYLTFDYSRDNETEEDIFKAYTLESDDGTPLVEGEAGTRMTIPKGLLQFLPSDLETVDKSIRTIQDYDVDGIQDCLEGITLRDDQVLAITKMTKVRNGIIQMATGAGKTECIAGFLINFYNHNGYFPSTLILEPTVHLVEATVKRLNAYGIPAEMYAKNRGTLTGISVTHPMSLNNDLKDDPTILRDLKVFITDECHRLSADTWRSLINYMDNVEFTLGVSASAIYPTKIPVKSLDMLDGDEVRIIGVTGNVILDIPPSYYINHNILARPVLLRMTNPANEHYGQYKSNWGQIRKKVLESPTRTSKISQVASFFSSCGFKCLILVGTKNHAYEVMKYVSRIGLSDKCRSSFGGGIYYKYNDSKDKPVKCSSDENVFQGFEEGKFSIFIGTSHIYEGMDVPNLDVVILGSVGKKLRRIIQGVGRAIRKSKTGNNAYIVDFTDHCNRVLRTHSLKRATICREIIGVPDSSVYGNLDLSTLKNIILQLEPQQFVANDKEE